MRGPDCPAAVSCPWRCKHEVTEFFREDVCNLATSQKTCPSRVFLLRFEEDAEEFICFELAMRKLAIKVLACLTANIVVMPLSAQEMTDSVHRIGEVEVYGRRPLATAQTLRGADLQALSTTSVADALKYFAGVQIKDYGGLGGLKTINVRSLGAQHVGIYIDGIRVTNAQNGTVDLGKFSLSAMESVELYNANKLDNCQSASEYASGATVYLRTRRPTKDSLSVQLRRASFSTYMAKANVQFASRGWSGFLDGEYTDSKGDYPFRYHSEYEDTVGRRANSDIRYGRIEGALFKGGFSSHVYYYDSERGCPGGIVRRLSDKYVNVGREWDRDFFVQASYQQEFLSHHRFKANVKYTNEYLRYCTDYPENQNTARVNNHYRQQDGYGALCYGYTPWPWLSLSTSYDVRYSKLQADLKMFDNVFRLDQKEVLAAQMNYRGVQAAVSMLHQHYHDFTFVHAGAADPLDRWTPAVSLAYTLKGVTVRGTRKSSVRPRSTTSTTRRWVTGICNPNTPNSGISVRNTTTTRTAGTLPFRPMPTRIKSRTALCVCR